MGAPYILIHTAHSCAQIATPPPWAGQEHLPCLRPARLWTQAWAQKADYGRHPQAWLIDALNSRVSRRAWKYGNEHNQRWQIRSTLKPTDPNYARHGWYADFMKQTCQIEFIPISSGIYAYQHQANQQILSFWKIGIDQLAWALEIET